LQNDGAAGAVDEHGQPAWQLHLAPAEEEQIIRKCRDDGFADTKLGQLLESHKVRRIVIGGLLAEMCVSATARTALARGFQVVLPHDAHGTYDVDDIPASVVARVAEHALGDGIEPEDEVTRHELGDEDRGRDPRGPGTVPVSVPPRATATGRGLAALDGGACRPEVRP